VTEAEPLTIPAVAEAAARRFGDNPAIVDGGRRLSFAGLWAESLKAARAFAGAGLVKGDRVAIWAPNSLDWIVACIGAQAAGCVVVTLNTRLKGSEAAFILNKSRARMLLTVRGFLGADYPALLADQDLPHVERTLCFGAEWQAFVAGAKSDTALPTVTADDPCDILFTSGTTGDPKGVVATHGASVRSFRTWAETVGLSAGDRYLIVNPFFHTFGYKAGWLSCLIAGATNYPLATFDTAKLVELVSEHRITVLPGPPAIFQTLLATDLGGADLSSLRLAVTGAASVPVALIERMRSELGIATVLTGYGLTESCGIVSISAADDPAEIVARTAGRPIPGVDVRIADPDESGAGEVLVRGFNVMRGYFEDAAATAEAIDSEGWLHTGDIGRFEPGGELVITDRIKDMYISGGFNCYPAEIERALQRHPDVALAAVIGVPDERLGEVGKAFVVPSAGRHPDPAALLAWARDNMANYKAPRSIEIIDALPLNASGKVQKFALRA
jgi:acyl-CoA synthetase (AMP-forming)/AMP-acid ligase II